MRYSAGIILFRGSKISDIEYLMLQNTKSQSWAPSKGHNNQGESDNDTAVREVKEETGLERKDYTMFQDFVAKVVYKTKTNAKTVTFFLAEVKPEAPPVRVSEEHRDHAWMKFEAACERIQHVEMNAAMRAAREFLIRSKKYGVP